MTPYVNIHTHYNNHIGNNEFVEIQNIDVDNIVNVDVSHFYSIGIHPWNLKSQNLKISETQKLGDLESQCLGDLNIKAIGECGLDRVCDVDFEIQKEVFIKQLKLSEQIAKPLIIHAVRTYPDIIFIRKETKAKQPWIIHGFQGNMQSAEQLLRHDGIYLSLGDVLFKNERRASELLNVIPLDRLFLETDVAERDIVEVYEKAVSLSGIEMDKLRNDIFNNFVKIFGQI
jgi:TatD DNase family protein